jgi:hypothetical protein
MAAPRIFISMGTPYSEKHSNFRDAVENFLRDQCKCDPRIIGKNEYPDGNPLTQIRDVMLSCHGVVVVAYERTLVIKGIEKRGGTGEKSLDEVSLTTPWNHIESAMAFGLKMPMYILCENGLKSEGLIEDKLDWRVQHIELSRHGLEQVDVAESIRSWVTKRVVPYSKTSNRWMRNLRGELRFSEMSPGELWKFFGTLTAIFLTGAAAAHFLPNFFTLLKGH